MTTEQKKKNLQLVILSCITITLSMIVIGDVQTIKSLDKQVNMLDMENRVIESNLEELQKSYDKMQKEHLKQEQLYLDALHKTRDYKELANTMQGEAGGQGIVGIEHCTSTVVNRIDTGHWGDTIHDVVSAPGQYDAYGVKYDEIQPDVTAAIDNVLIYGATNDAIYYMNPETSSKTSRSWMRTKPFILKYKDHEFYGG